MCRRLSLNCSKIFNLKKIDEKLRRIIDTRVAVPKIEILGDRDMYVKTGSTVAIRCVIKQSLEGPFYVFWYHEGDRILTYQLNKIDIQTKRMDQDTVSSLVIHNAKRDDSGNYTCSPSNLDSASVQLHVLNGEWDIRSCENEKLIAAIKKKNYISGTIQIFFRFPSRELSCNSRCLREIVICVCPNFLPRLIVFGV